MKQEAAQLQEDMMYTEKAHFAAAERARLVYFSLGVLATAGSACAAASIIASKVPTIGGIAALIATVCASLMTFSRPQDSAQKHHGSATALGALRVKLRMMADLDLRYAMDSELSDSRNRIEEIAGEKAVLDAAAPVLSERSFQVARKKISRGDFRHQTDG